MHAGDGAPPAKGGGSGRLNLRVAAAGCPSTESAKSSGCGIRIVAAASAANLRLCFALYLLSVDGSACRWAAIDAA